MGAAAVFAEDTRTGTPSAAARRRHIERLAKLAGRIACDLDAIGCNAKTLAAKGGE